MIIEKLDKWSDFDSKHSKLIDAFNNLELQIRTELDNNIESAFNKLNNVSSLWKSINILLNN